MSVMSRMAAFFVRQLQTVPLQGIAAMNANKSSCASFEEPCQD